MHSFWVSGFAGLGQKLGPGFSGLGLMYSGPSIEPGPTGSGLGRFQLYFRPGAFKPGRVPIPALVLSEKLIVMPGIFFETMDCRDLGFELFQVSISDRARAWAGLLGNITQAKRAVVIH